MKYVPGKRIFIMVVGSMLCGACVSTGGFAGGGSKSANDMSFSSADPGQFGSDYAVLAAVGHVKARGSEARIGSTAIRLPERPLGEIAAYTYRYPADCGGHEFHVYEADKMQILEYRFAAENGERHQIRDYIEGPSPFVRPGLWTAYDHTAATVSRMSPKYEMRGYRMFNGVYSQGLVTNIPNSEQRDLGYAYQQALSDAFACRSL